MNKIYFPFIFLSLIVLSSCSSQPNIQRISTPFPTIVPMNVICTTAYRSSVSVPIETTIPVTLSKENDKAELEYKDLVFHAWYFNGSPYELRSLKLWVTTKDSNDEIFSVLYQLSRSEKLINQVLEHGFTGLNYIYNPTFHSELQFWCVAE